MTFGEVLIRFGADTAPFMAGIAGMGGGTKALKGAIVMNMLAASAAVIGVGVAIGVTAIHMAGDFQQSITKLYTTAGEAKSNLQMVGDGILAMSTQVGTGAQQLADAMYWIESGGLHGAQGLEALRVAAQAAKAENANLIPVSIALAASFNAYAGSGMTAVQVMNTLTAATGQGMMTFEQLSGSLASVLPAAAKFHISLVNVTAALATMTAQGDPAAQAATHLKQMILALEAPSKIGAAALKSVGLTSAQVATEMKTSLPGALKMITDAVGKKFPEGSAAYNQAIKNIAGGSKQMMGFLELTGTHMGTFVGNVKKISGAVKSGGHDLMGWSDIQQNLNFKLDQAKAATEAFMITLGQALLPAVTSLVAGIVPLIAGLTGFVKWMQQGSAWANVVKVAFAIFAALLIGVFVAALVMVAIAAWNATAAFIGFTWPIILIVAGVLLLAAAIYLLVTHWGAVVAFLSAIWGAFVSWFMNILTDIGTFFVGVWSAIVIFFIGIWSAIVIFFAGIWNGVVAVVAAVVARIIAIWSAITSFFSGLWNGIVSIVSTVVSAIVGFFVSMWARMQPILNVMKIVMLILFAPLILGIALVIAPIIGLIFLFTHFQEVMGFLRGFIAMIWSAIVSIFTTAFATIGGWFTWLYNHNHYIKDLCDIIRNVFAAVIAWIQAAWQNIVTWLTNLWNTLKDIVTTAWNAVKAAVMVVVEAVVVWLQTRWNTAVANLTAIWDTIKGIATTAWNDVKAAVMVVVSAVVAWLIGRWNNAVANLTQLWDTIKGIATTAWNDVKAAVMVVVSAIISWVMARWNTFKNNITTAWNALAGIATTAWNNVTAAFSAAWGKISTVLGTLLGNITGWFTDLAAKAVTWGVALIQGFINGILSMVGQVGGAVGQIAGKVVGFLGFHSSVIGPSKEGPGRDLERWGPALTSGFAAGMLQNLPMVQDAMNRIMAPIRAGMSGGGTSGSAGSAGSSAAKQPIQLNMNVNGRTFASAIIPDLAQTIAVQVGGAH